MVKVMRIAGDFLAALTDYSDLENLPLYGDFLTLYALPARGSIAEVGKIYGELKVLDQRIFCLYVSYILSRSGYYLTDILDSEADANGEPAQHLYPRNLAIKTG